MELPVLVSSHSSHNHMPEVTTGQVSFDNELGQIQYLYGSVMYSAYMIRSTVVVRLTIVVLLLFVLRKKIHSFIGINLARAL